jgi:hypothetical protein
VTSVTAKLPGTLRENIRYEESERLPWPDAEKESSLGGRGGRFSHADRRPHFCLTNAHAPRESGKSWGHYRFLFFLYIKDTKNRCVRSVIYSNEEFVRLLMPHVNDRYCNSMRYFGLLASRSKMQRTQVFSVLKQQQRPRPVRLRYAEAICRTFGQNPLIGLDGRPLLRVGHINPLVST